MRMQQAKNTRQMPIDKKFSGLGCWWLEISDFSRILWVRTKKNSYFFFFILEDGFIFFDRCLKSHKIFIFDLLSTLLEISWKFSKINSKIFYKCFFEFLIKTQNNLWNFLVWFQYVNQWKSQSNIGSDLLMKFTLLGYQVLVVQPASA